MPVFRWTSRLSPRARTRTLVSGTLITGASLGAATLASVPGPAQPAAAASVSCPWVGSSAPIPQRVSQLLAKMTVAQKVTVLTGLAGPATSGSPRPSGRCVSRP